MPFEPGNTYGAKKGKFGHELNKAIAQGDPEILRRIAEKLLSKALEGDLMAIRELADRLDGKSVQAVNASVEHHAVDVGSVETIRARLRELNLADRIQNALDRQPAQVSYQTPPVDRSTEAERPPRAREPAARVIEKFIDHLADYRGHSNGVPEPPTY